MFHRRFPSIHARRALLGAALLSSVACRDDGGATDPSPPPTAPAPLPRQTYVGARLEIGFDFGRRDFFATLVGTSLPMVARLVRADNTLELAPAERVRLVSRDTTRIRVTPPSTIHAVGLGETWLVLSVDTRDGPMRDSVSVLVTQFAATSGARGSRAAARIP